ncbi:LLM class flavin-dependent oxidoreductase [Otariodibacter oris]|uniref:Putative LLM family oxidoreductase n=1 Tax=Otariodibacter oris TaxID=1032623 RepID=A0A420XK48_9PAST|nr:LLM class flavin-dependent oxidoreductase [Otariodibacter oris]RKR77460.1 putative LLM family oxidoreductase [Otariodibacter oris]
MIELGIDMFGDLQIDPKTGKAKSPAKRMQEMVEEVKLMDEVGLDFFAIGEHHREEYAVSSPEIFLAAVAPVTKNIKLSSAVSIISSADPVKLYKDFAMVDLLSDGRAEIMAGRGSFIESFPVFGYELKNYDALFEEKLNLLLELNEKETISWKGEYRPSLNNQPIYPQPKNGNIPIWVAVGGTPESVIRAASLRLPVMFAIIGGTIDRFKPLFEYYKQAWVHAGNDIKDYQVGVHMHSLFGENDQEIADSYFPLYAEQRNRTGASRNWPPYQRIQYDYGRKKLGHLIVGDASHATEKIIEAIEVLGLTRFSAHMDVGAPDHATMMKSIEIYGDKIAPKVREALKK